MEHIYENIEGWFGFEKLYSEMVDNYNNAIFVEVGSWLGKSSSYMAVEIFNKKKNIEFFCVDTWEGSSTESLHQNHELCVSKKLYDQFLLNIEPVKEIIKPIRNFSVEASKLFLDETLDFCFIDADHRYENVLQDLLHWFPKIKAGGTFGGHDYNSNWPGVMKAVDEFVSNNNLILNIHSEQSSWSVLK